MAQKPFAHRGTTKKLRTVFDYLSFYTRALHGKFRLTYFDAFAGSGEIPHGDELPLLSGSEDYLNVVDGSARRALTVDPPFDRYVFVDQNKRNTAELMKLKNEFPMLADRIEIITDDANRAVQEFCNSDLTPRDRAVVFLDPFGNQVKWPTIQTIARTSGIDLWYLFPSGLGVVRQLSADGEIQKDAEQSINELFGTSDWYAALTIQSHAADLFDPIKEERIKVATADAVTRFMIARMKTIFKGGVLEEWLPLGKRGGHWHSLIFAWTNPSAAASSLASRVAKDIMRKK